MSLPTFKEFTRREVAAISLAGDSSVFVSKTDHQCSSSEKYVIANPRGVPCLISHPIVREGDLAIDVHDKITRLDLGILFKVFSVIEIRRELTTEGLAQATHFVLKEGSPLDSMSKYSKEISNLAESLDQASSILLIDV